MISFKAQITQIKKHRLHRFLFIFALLMLSSCAARHTHFMEDLDFTRVKDGTYTGSDTSLLCSVKLATTIKDGKISDIKILSHYVTYPLAGRAYDIIPKRIVEKQSLDVDAVTAATVSTNNIKRAVRNALTEAKERR